MDAKNAVAHTVALECLKQVKECIRYPVGELRDNDANGPIKGYVYSPEFRDATLDALELALDLLGDINHDHETH